MAKVYADLVCKGLRTLASIPKAIREAVKQELIDRGHPELAAADTE